ncbi:MAG: Uma2 family endonuclease [Verrucomicrobiales bacterium]|jgi:Uma2 family endonuclease
MPQKRDSFECFRRWNFRENPAKLPVMETLMIQLPLRKDQHAFNLKRWEEVCADPELAKIPNRIETNRHGNLVMLPLPGGMHGYRQSEIGYLLQNQLPHGRCVSECPISTADGVRAADVSWLTKERHDPIAKMSCFPIAPEICVEIVSPSNSKAEIKEKTALYFDAGAEEVWVCDLEGGMSFFVKNDPGNAAETSALCPDFLRVIELS